MSLAAVSVGVVIKGILLKTLATKLHNSLSPGSTTAKTVITISDLVTEVTEALSNEGFEIVEKQWLREIEKEVKEIHTLLLKKDK